MKSAVETLNPTRVKLTIEVPFDELKPSLDAAYKTIAGQVNVPGFRKGKVPPRIIDQRFGRGVVLEEAVNSALPRFYAKAVEESDVRPLGQPEVDVTEVPDPTGGGELKFTAEVDVRPEFTLPDLSAVEVTVDDVEVTDEDVQARLDNLRARFGTLVPVERPVADDDFVSVDISAEIDGEEIDSVKGVSYQVGSGNMLDGMDEALRDLSAGETTTFVTPLAGGDRAGQDAQVTVTVQSVKVRELPALDDDFAQLASEFDTLDELRDNLREQAANAKRFEQGIQARERLLEKLLDAVEIPVPEGLVSAEVHRHLESEHRLEDEEHRAEVEEETRKGVRTQLLLDAIAEAEQVSVGQQELIEYLVISAQQYGMDPNEFAKAMDEAGQVPAMVGEVARRKGLATVLERAVVKDASGNPVDLNALAPQRAGVEEEAGESAEEAAAPAASAADPTAITVSDLGGFEPAES
ncbi:MAG TPA: trigger factor [Kineosporiaceae bacterium]|nr:trigger factor [Kineosporiaceae bacterium]